MKQRIRNILPLILALGGGAAVADSGQDTQGFHGYLRVGTGTSHSGSHGSQSCYGLGGNTYKYRLGNECDSDFEGGYTTSIAQSDGVRYDATLWIIAYGKKSGFRDAEFDVLKGYVEAKGLDFLNGGTAWIGKRYYNRPGINMLDLQYINFSGTGAGLDKIQLGPGKFSYAFFKDNDINIVTPDGATVLGSLSATRHNLMYQDLPVNRNGTIEVNASIIRASRDDTLAARHNGWQASVFHRQKEVFGGVNTLGVQYGVGPGTGIGGEHGGMGSSGSTLLGSDVTRLRVFNDLWVQPVWNFGMEFVVLVQKDKSDALGSSRWTTLGVRPVYALTRNLKLVAELGTDRVSSPNGGPAKRLTKLTIAPTISAGPGLLDRPELRAFVTYGKWNDAATASVNAANNSGPVYNNGTSGVSLGVQVEAWF